MYSNAQWSILLIQDSETCTQINQALGSQGYRTTETNSGEEALARVNYEPFDLVILEINLPGMDGYQLCRHLRETEATRHLPILMLTQRTEIADKVAGFEAGIDDFLSKPFQAQELVYRVKILLQRSHKHAQAKIQTAARGKIIALFGTKGGVGRTTIGVNLAVALQRRTRGKTVLFDADFFFGDVALHLNLPPSRTILDLMGRTNQFEEDRLDQVLVPHHSGVRVLLSPRNPEDVESISPDHIAHVLDMLAATNDYIVVDCQASYDERTLTILEKADSIMLIIKPEVGCVKNMAIFSELAIKLGLSFEEKIHIVLNRAGSKSGIGPKEIERIFRRQIGFHIASGGNSVVVSVNRGVPLSIENPSHPFSTQVGQMADFLLRNLPLTAG